MDDDKYDQIRQVILITIRQSGHYGGDDHGHYIPKSQLLGVLMSSAYMSDIIELEEGEYIDRDDVGDVLDVMQSKQELTEFSKQGEPHIAFAPKMANAGDEARDKYYEEEFGLTSIEHRG